MRTDFKFRNTDKNNNEIVFQAKFCKNCVVISFYDKCDKIQSAKFSFEELDSMMQSGAWEKI